MFQRAGNAENRYRGISDAYPFRAEDPNPAVPLVDIFRQLPR